MDDASNPIKALRQRTTSDAFVIFEAQPSGQYVQFFNGGDAVFYDFTVRSASRRGAPDPLQVGEIVNAPPTLGGDMLEHRYMSVDQAARLRGVLKAYGFDHISTYQLAYEPGQDSVVGFFEIIRGEYKLDADQSLSFLHDVFGKAYGLENYSIRVIEN